MLELSIIFYFNAVQHLLYLFDNTDVLMFCSENSELIRINSE